MNLQKTVISFLLVGAVIGGIVYLNSQKVNRGSGEEVIAVAPRPPDSSGVENKKFPSSKEKLNKCQN